jgi:hypothetical protein
LDARDAKHHESRKLINVEVQQEANKPQTRRVVEQCMEHGGTTPPWDSLPIFWVTAWPNAAFGLLMRV